MSKYLDKDGLTYALSKMKSAMNDTIESHSNKNIFEYSYTITDVNFKGNYSTVIAYIPVAKIALNRSDEELYLNLHIHQDISITSKPASFSSPQTRVFVKNEIDPIKILTHFNGNYSNTYKTTTINYGGDTTIDGSYIYPCPNGSTSVDSSKGFVLKSRGNGEFELFYKYYVTHGSGSWTGPFKDPVTGYVKLYFCIEPTSSLPPSCDYSITSSTKAPLFLDDMNNYNAFLKQCDSY